MVSRDPQTKVHEILGTTVHWLDPWWCQISSAPEKMCARYLKSKICAPRKVTKVHQNALRSAMHQCPSLCQISSRSATRCTRKALQKILHPSVFGHLRGTFWAKVHQSPHWCTARPGLTKCKISSPSDNPCTRYLLRNFIHFVESVIDWHDRQKQKSNTKRYVSTYHAATTTGMMRFSRSHGTSY